MKLSFTPVGVVVEKEMPAGKLVGYITYDHEARLMDDSYKIYTAKRGASSAYLEGFRSALGLDSDYQRDESITPNRWAVKLDVYEHSGSSYSISGEGQQCRWDTAKGGAVWVPGDDLVIHLAGMNGGFGATTEQVFEACRDCLNEYNDFINGENYGVCIDTLDTKGNVVESDQCWGFIGRKHAEESMKADYFEPTVSHLLGASA